MCLSVYVCARREAEIRLVLWGLIETLPWIEPDISKVWHGRRLLLSSHCFIYHPTVSVSVCVFTYSGILHRDLCSQRRIVWESEEAGDMGFHGHTPVFATLDFVQDLHFVLRFRCDIYTYISIYIFLLSQGQWWHCGENGNEVCVHWSFVSMCRGMCMLYNTRTVLQRRAACWLSEVEERASVLAEPLSNNKSFT